MKENSEFKPVKLRLKIDLVSYPARAEGLVNSTMHYDQALLNNKDIKDRYVLALRNKFDALLEKTEIHTANDEYENITNAHLHAAAKYIPTKNYI